MIFFVILYTFSCLHKDNTEILQRTTLCLLNVSVLVENLNAFQCSPAFSPRRQSVRVRLLMFGNRMEIVLSQHSFLFLVIWSVLPARRGNYTMSMTHTRRNETLVLLLFIWIKSGRFLFKQRLWQHMNNLMITVARPPSGLCTD